MWNQKSELTISCNECEAEWHLKCCGLEGLTKGPITTIDNKGWKCPSCFEPAIHVQKTKSTPPALTKEIVNNIVTIVNSTVGTNLKQLLSAENLTEDTTSIAEDFTLVHNRRRERAFQRVLEDQKEEETLIEKKKANLIIYGMPESNLDDNKEELSMLTG